MGTLTWQKDFLKASKISLIVLGCIPACQQSYMEARKACTQHNPVLRIGEECYPTDTETEKKDMSVCLLPSSYLPMYLFIWHNKIFGG